MKNSKSGKIATRFVKDTILITAPMLATIFNKSTQCGTFPNNLKIAKVCPVYKGKGRKIRPRQLQTHISTLCYCKTIRKANP